MSDGQLLQTSLWANRKCLLICCVVSIANLQYGLDSAAVGGLQAMPGFLKVFGYANPVAPGGYSIGSTFQQLIASLLTLGSFVSALTAGTFSHFFGRKVALWIACVLNSVACVLQMTSTSAASIYVGRLILGFANGFLVTFSNIYTSEASPAHLRGVIVALFAYWVNIGSIIGAAVTNATKGRLDKASYQIPIGTLFIVPTILAIGLLFVPESPRYLLAKGRMEEAKQSLELLRGTSVPAEYVEMEWVEMVNGIEEEKRHATTVGALDMFKGTDLRRTLLCFGMIACQTGSGVWFVISYGTYFLIVSGLSVSDAFKYSIMATCFGFLGVNMGMYLMRRHMGRRSILILGGFICGLSQLAIAVAATVAPGTKTTGRCLITFTAIFKWGYNMCVGAASYPVATELVSTRLRAWTVGSATSLGYSLAWLNAFCTPYFINPQNLGLGAKYGYIWAGSNFLCVLFFFFFMPEMKGRTLEEIDELFANKVSPLKFKSYQTTIRHEAAEVEEKVLETKGATIELRERISTSRQSQDA
ncbi:general substrate transporter [Clohesyomyces aquaticus]|uniref:General substrate transporter n=1 Tax=Clohesyomyces aquaticus TaxID=1231657 RepID=A0A1Y2A329_9PLEO|nr:general substrate transporter [Clohesyomyces aquaticus]